MSILVTGGTGYIGSHTVVELQQAGYEVIVVDNLSNSNPAILDQIASITGIRPTFEHLDLTDEALVVDFIARNEGITGVIHFAAFKAVGESVKHPTKYYRNNLFSLVNLITAFANREVSFVFSSSCTVYGQPDVLPVTEQAPVKTAESPYGNTKQICEEIMIDASKADANYKFISLRYFNPVGAHASAKIGELPIGIPQNLVPFITQSAIGKRGPITVFGTDYQTPDGSCIRDYIHVVDLAKAHVAAIARLESAKTDATYEVFNVGTGRGSSVLEVINAFESSTGVKVNYALGDRRPGDVEQVWGDVTQVKAALGWEAALGLNEMMLSAWAWENYLKEHPIS